MVKYNFELKKKIVLEYLEKGYSSNYLCKKYNIKKRGTILYWVKLYQTYGLSGIKPMENHIIYTGEFKQKVLHWMHTHDSSYPETALQFKISSPSVIFTWQRRLETKGLSGLYTTPGRPKMTNKNLSEQNIEYKIKYLFEILKYKNLNWLERIEELFLIIPDYSKSFILKQLNISRSNYYYHKNKLINNDNKLINLIKKIKIENPFFGYRRITLALKKQNQIINHKKVLRIMKQHNLNNSAYQKKQRKYNSYDRKSDKYAKNRLNRRFNTDRPYQKLTTDISEFRYGNQNINHRVYLSPILDLFSGEILAYEINDHPTTKTVISSLKKAIKRIPSLDYRTTIHSDRGIQYQSLEWNTLLKENKFFKSMSHKGTCLDNASMESFFHLMKTEMMFKKYQSKEELIDAMKEWIRYYNEDRIKTKLEGKSPIEYRKFALEKILN